MSEFPGAAVHVIFIPPPVFTAEVAPIKSLAGMRFEKLAESELDELSKQPVIKNEAKNKMR